METNNQEHVFIYVMPPKHAGMLVYCDACEKYVADKCNPDDAAATECPK